MIGTVRTMSTQDALVTQRRVTADLNQRLSQAGQEASTGMKADIFRSIGLRASEALTLRAGMARNDTFISSNEMLASRLDVTALKLKQTRETAQSFLDLAISNVDMATQTAGELQREAKMVLDRLIGHFNTTFRGVPLFAGTDSGQLPVLGWDEDHSETSVSPRKVFEDTIGAGIGNVDDAATKATTLRDAFESAANGGLEGEDLVSSVFFNGTPHLEADGSPGPRITARIDETTVLAHGVQANDQAFSDLLRGVSMLAATDATKISDPEAYRVWVGEAVNAVSAGIAGLIDTKSRLGGNQQMVEQTLQMQRDRADLYNSRVLALEGVDPYEAATRVSELQTQLEASYAITARLSKRQFLNFI